MNIQLDGVEDIENSLKKVKPSKLLVTLASILIFIFTIYNGWIVKETLANYSFRYQSGEFIGHYKESEKRFDQINKEIYEIPSLMKKVDNIEKDVRTVRDNQIKIMTILEKMENGG